MGSGAADPRHEEALMTRRIHLSPIARHAAAVALLALPTWALAIGPVTPLPEPDSLWLVGLALAAAAAVAWRGRR
jgi:hypothetical protein